jgi:alanyl-tRNA synthetase
MQFNRDEARRHAPAAQAVGRYRHGAGAHFAAVLQGVHANYEIDLFQALIKAAARETSGADMDSPSLKVLADHIRACSFLIADGVIPATKAAATCCAASSAAPSATATNSARAPPSSTRWCPTWLPRWAMAYPELVQEPEQASWPR